MLGYFFFFYPLAVFLFVKNTEVSGPQVYPILPFTKLSGLSLDLHPENCVHTHGCTSPSVSACCLPVH